MGEYEDQARQVRERNEEYDRRKSIASYNELKKKINISINTTMIGALEDFEKYFGFLWGHGDDNASDQQIAVRESWEKARESILDRGNASIETANYHLSRFSVSDKNNGFTHQVSNNQPIKIRKG